MFGYSTICPNCKHEFQCCPLNRPPCCPSRRSLHASSGGGLVALEATRALQSPFSSPVVSARLPMTFIVPPLRTPLHPVPVFRETKPETEMEMLADTVRALRQSGWFYEGLSYQQCNELLRETQVGTFLMRYSSDPKFYFSMSVQTERGPLSVRLFYVNGYFRLDSQPHLKSAMPMFPNVISLVEHYIAQTRLSRTNAHVWVDPQGKWYSSILLDKPFKKQPETLRLKHLAGLAVHRALRATGRPSLALLPPLHTQLDLPKSLIEYLSEYPFSI